VVEVRDSVVVYEVADMNDGSAFDALLNGLTKIKVTVHFKGDMGITYDENVILIKRLYRLL
jgi:hypothetical protein